ncbi:MAG: calcium-binding protein [Bacteroidales bacterium]
MEIKIGDSVRVKPGAKDPDYENDMRGWQGRVTHIDTDEGKFIEIAWDSITLNQMPVELIETSIEEKIEALNEQFEYTSSDEQSKNIAKILDSKDLSVIEENQDKFFVYLSEHIKYPCLLTGTEDFSWEEPYLFGVFDQEEYERLKKKRASYTDHFKLVRLEDIIDDLQGILVKVKRIGDKKVFVLPLWDLKTVDRKDENHQLFEDYSYWMSNYR